MKRGVAFLLALLLAAALVFPVTAEETPPPEGEGSIRLTLLNTEKKPVSGGTLMLYALAILDEEGHFVPTEAFAAFSADIGNWNEQYKPAMAETIWAYIQEKAIPGTPSQLSAAGEASWSGLENGLYLIGQTVPGSKGELCSPFLVSVPYWENDEWQYQVDASPKAGAAETPSKPPRDDDKPHKPSGPHLPQTGQLWWPVPVLLGGGALLILLGVLLLKRRRSKDET